MMASAMVHSMIIKVVHVVNKYGNDIGVFAYEGKRFLGLTWTAVVLMFIASVVWVTMWSAARKAERGPKVWDERGE